MDSAIRQPLQGTINIIRFNWPLYVVVLCLIAVITTLGFAFPSLRSTCLILGPMVLLPLLISLFTSWLVYDHSALYKLPWLHRFRNEQNDILVSISAGFDETSGIIKAILPHRQFHLFDFYDPEMHTEASIKRARKLHPAPEGTRMITTHSIPLADNAADKIFIIFSAHEIRNELERTRFFEELKRVLKPEGQIFLTEHLRDLPNFLAYNIGFLHFYSKKTWQNTIDRAGLQIIQNQKTTAFVTTFTVIKNGISS